MKLGLELDVDIGIGEAIRVKAKDYGTTVREYV
jgi:hypothetical protein